MNTTKLRWLERFVSGNKKKTLAVALITAIVMVGGSALGSENSDDHFTNLKILPKNISSKSLNQIMVDEFSDGLGISCMFCHAENKETHKIDYASDANPQKDMARKMMKLTLKINKHFFEVKHPSIGSSVMIVKCVSCHHGVAFPYPAE
jgi:hypothetical protein